jgi:hypothetical protein
MMSKQTVVARVSASLLLTLCCLCAPMIPAAQAAESASALFTIKAEFDPQLLDSLEVRMLCPSAMPERQSIPFSGPGEIEIRVEKFSEDTGSCQLVTEARAGYSIIYSGEGEGIFKADRNGCQFSRLLDGQRNFCQIELVQDPVQITAYKKWIGGAEDEADIRIRLECESGEYTGYRYINEGLPAGWEISRVDPQGVVCSVFEAPGDAYIADEFDCQSLVIFPGKSEECTMVNTKIVKRIEMLNRYGKVIMILVMLLVGLISVKRLV